jgi:hypothetical protein
MDILAARHSSYGKGDEQIYKQWFNYADAGQETSSFPFLVLSSGSPLPKNNVLQFRFGFSTGYLMISKYRNLLLFSFTGMGSLAV